MKKQDSRRDDAAPVRAALEYADLGLRFIPLHDRSKAPRIRDWTGQCTCDPGIISGWFAKWPRSNVGILTGGGLVALDIDPAKGGVESFGRLWGHRKPPFTAVANTGSDGYHYLFRVDPGLRIGNRVGLRPGLDIRGEGGQIVVGPSVHPETGRPYSWVFHPNQGIAQAPQWLVKLLAEKCEEPPKCDASPFEIRPGLTFDRRGDAGKLGRELVERFPVTAYGQRNREMVRAVGSLLGRGYEPHLVLEAVTAWWEYYFSLGVVRTSPAEAPKAIRACIETTLRNPAFTQSAGVDHRAMCRRIELDEGPRMLIASGAVDPGDRTLHSPTSNRVTPHDGDRGPLCRTLGEVAFVEAFVVYFSYKLHVLRETPVKATRSDLRGIIEDHHRLELANSQFERLKRRYITREGRPATIFELAVQTREGAPGVASEFEPTGILGLLPAEPGTLLGAAGGLTAA